MKYDRQSISLFYGLPHANRTNWPIVIVWRQITPKGRCWNPALFFRESDRVDPRSRIYRSLSQPFCVDKAFGEDTASWVSWMSVSMNNYLEKFYLSGLSKYGMHTSRCLTDFMTYYVWHSTRYPSSEQRGNVFAGISVQCAKERNQDAASDSRPSTHTHTRTHARTHVHRKNRDRDRETKRQRQRDRQRGWIT